MEGAGDILIACSVDDLYWLKRSLKGKERLIGRIINNEGLTPLHVAAQHLHINSIKCILSRCGSNADINIATNNTGDTPLHLALKRLNKSSEGLVFQCINFLIEKGSHCNRQNKKGQTPLHLAASAGLPTILELLLSHGANFTDKDNNGQTPCDVATLYGHYEIVRILRALQWAKEKDDNTRRVVQMEKQAQEEEEKYLAIANESRKQLAEESYASWVYQNSLSSIEPPGNVMSRLRERQQSNKLYCTSCPATVDGTESKIKNVTHAMALGYCSQSPIHAHRSRIKVAPTQISLKQSDHNIESIGNPSMMFPYTNYPPVSYKQNYLKQARSKSTRPSSSMSTHFTRPRSRAIKSAPTPCIVHTPEPSSRVSLKECAYGKSKKKKKFKVDNCTDTSTCSKANSIHTVSVDIQDLPREPMSECNEPHSIEQNKQEKSTEAVDPLEEGDGSTSSIDLTFHEVGPENNLQSLASAAVTAGSLSPTELLKILRISNSSKQKIFKKSQSFPFRQSSSLSAIPEGEVVTQYKDEEGSQLLDTNFLHSLMPYAFEDTDFQGIDEKEITRMLANDTVLTEGISSTSADEPDNNTENPLFVAWDDNSVVERNSAVQQNSLENSSQSAEKTFPHAKRKVNSAIPKLQQYFLKQKSNGRTVLKTALVQFDGNLKYVS